LSDSFDFISMDYEQQPRHLSGQPQTLLISQ